MEETKEMLVLLQKIESANRRQARMTTLMCVFTLVSALCLAGALVLLWGLIPQADAVLTQAQTVLGNLEQTSQSLADADLGSLVANVDALAAAGQESLAQTMEKLNAIDIEALNKAIQDLANVVEPLSRLANLFG